MAEGQTSSGQCSRRFRRLNCRCQIPFSISLPLLHLLVGRAVGSLQGPLLCQFPGGQLDHRLDLVGQEEAIGDEAVERYERMYQHPLPRKTRAALQAITRIASGAVMEATAALAAEAGAAEVEAN